MSMACVNKKKWLIQLGGKDILAKIKSSTTESMTSLRINRLCSLNMLALLYSLMADRKEDIRHRLELCV